MPALLHHTLRQASPAGFQFSCEGVSLESPAAARRSYLPLVGANEDLRSGAQLSALLQPIVQCPDVEVSHCLACVAFGISLAFSAQVHHQLSCLLIHASALDAGAVIPKLAARARAVHYVNFWLRS